MPSLACVAREIIQISWTAKDELMILMCKLGERLAVCFAHCTTETGITRGDGYGLKETTFYPEARPGGLQCRGAGAQVESWRTILRT